mmetsp:Transcript_19593/g.33261  ORF Transcript_19593/g.33261 Transcript_19593/m.33261 type:complete len:200 (-) Transcript_19593:366-965(-)
MLLPSFTKPELAPVPAPVPLTTTFELITEVSFVILLELLAPAVAVVVAEVFAGEGEEEFVIMSAADAFDASDPEDIVRTKLRAPGIRGNWELLKPLVAAVAPVLVVLAAGIMVSAPAASLPFVPVVAVDEELPRVPTRDPAATATPADLSGTEALSIFVDKFVTAAVAVAVAAEVGPIIVADWWCLNKSSFILPVLRIR